MTDKIVVLSACDSEEKAAGLARHLVERRLAACVNIVPGARSIYRWKGVIEDAPEWLLVIKSRRDLFRRPESRNRQDAYLRGSRVDRSACGGGLGKLSGLAGSRTGPRVRRVNLVGSVPGFGAAMSVGNRSGVIWPAIRGRASSWPGVAATS